MGPPCIHSAVPLLTTLGPTWNPLLAIVLPDPHTHTKESKLLFVPSHHHLALLRSCKLEEIFGQDVMVGGQFGELDTSQHKKPRLIPPHPPMHQQAIFCTLPLLPKSTSYLVVV